MSENAKVATADAEIDVAIRHAAVYAKFDRRVVRATYSSRTDRILMRLDHGVTCSIPRKLLQGLAAANPEALSRIEILGHGTGLYWPRLDVAHEVSGLLAGVYGSEKWMAHLQLESSSGRRSA
jgi:hypothetical protein